MKNKCVITIVIQLLFFSFCNAQDFNEGFYFNKSFNSRESKKLYLRIQNSNFFKNNEYFGSFAKGYTLLGGFLRPALVYYPGYNTSIMAGIHLLKYSGVEKLSQALPLLSFTYKPEKDISFTLGTINGGMEHRMTEPLYNRERHFTHNAESGAQFIIDKAGIFSDSWCDWEKFVFRHADEKEVVAGGNSTELNLLRKEKGSKADVIFQAIAVHKGGQIDNSEEPVQTLLNTAVGLRYEYEFNAELYKIGTVNYYLTYNDLSQEKNLHFKRGNAFYFNLYTRLQLLNLFLGYWRGDSFIAPRGEPLFQSVSDFDKDFTQKKRELFTAKLSYHKPVTENIRFEVRMETYYDLINYQLEYSGGLYLQFSRDFFLKKIK